MSFRELHLALMALRIPKVQTVYFRLTFRCYAPSPRHKHLREQIVDLQIRTFLGDGLFIGKTEMEKEEEKENEQAENGGASGQGGDERKGSEDSEQTSLLSAFSFSSSSSSDNVAQDPPFHDSEDWLKLQSTLLESLEKGRKSDEDDLIILQKPDDVVRRREETWVSRNGDRRVVNLVDVTRNYICVKFIRCV